MKILFACDDGSYVVEVLPGRLFAKVSPAKDHQTVYDGHYNLLLNPGAFHEYREHEAMLENRIETIILDELTKLEKTQKK